jgi:tRNA A22 N-methylase
MVDCMPSMRAVNIQPLPEELVQAADLSSSLPLNVWSALEQLQLEGTFHQCQITGLGTLTMSREGAQAEVRCGA